MRRSGRLLAALALGWLLAAQALPAVEATARTAKYAADIERLAAAPAPAPGGVLLIGSSIFRKWTTCVADLAPLPVTNHAFGGSQTPEQLFFFDQLVPSSRAGVVVWYCGSNDVNAKRTPADVLANTREWLDLTRAALPGVRVVLVSVIRAPQKRTDGKLAPVDEINRGLLALGEADDVEFVVAWLQPRAFDAGLPLRAALSLVALCGRRDAAVRFHALVTSLRAAPLVIFDRAVIASVAGLV